LRKDHEGEGSSDRHNAIQAISRTIVEPDWFVEMS